MSVYAPTLECSEKDSDTAVSNNELESRIKKVKYSSNFVIAHNFNPKRGIAPLVSNIYKNILEFKVKEKQTARFIGYLH